MTRLRIAAAACAFAGAGPAAAQDEVANGAVFGDWVVNCEAVSTARTTCRVSQTQSRTSDNTLLLQLIAYPTETGGAILVAQVPIGTYLATGLLFQPEAEAAGTPAQGMIWQRCLGQLCEAALEMDAEALGALAGQGPQLFAYTPEPGAERTIIRVNTDALGAALDAIRR